MQQIRLSKRTVAANALHHTGCGKLFRLAGSWGGLLVLNYHRIGDCRHSPLDRELWSAGVEDFDQQVRAVSRDFDIVGMDDLEHVLARQNGRYVLITFDDGYVDNYIDAFPILKSYGAKATFFITTGFLDVPRIPWWDQIAWMVNHSTVAAIPSGDWFHAPVKLGRGDRSEAIRSCLNVYKRLEGQRTAAYLEFLTEALQSGCCPDQVAHELWMTWPMIREMSQAGMTIGGHTVNHPILANLTPEEQDFEVRECQRRLTTELGRPATAFSYPVGGRSSYNRFTCEALERHGFRWGFTYLGGHLRTPSTNRYEIPRTAVETDVSHAMFSAMVTLPQLFA